MLYQIKVDNNSVTIGDKVKYYDKIIYITQINKVDFLNKTMIVRGREITC